MLFKVFFSFIGALLLFTALSFFMDTRSLLKTSLISNGTVIDIVATGYGSNDEVIFSPVVEFVTLDGELITFTSSDGGNPPGYTKGESVDISYDPQSPKRAKINSFFSLWGGAAIFAVMGGICFSIGFIPFLIGLLRSIKAKRLKNNGVALQAKVIDIEEVTLYSINGKSPYKIIATYQKSKNAQLQTFKSQNIWFKPKRYKNRKITVYINKNNPKRYYVDLSIFSA